MCEEMALSNILREVPTVVPHMRTTEILTYQNSFLIARELFLQRVPSSGPV